MTRRHRLFIVAAIVIGIAGGAVWYVTDKSRRIKEKAVEVKSKMQDKLNETGVSDAARKRVDSILEKAAEKLDPEER